MYNNIEIKGLQQKCIEFKKVCRKSNGRRVTNTKLLLKARKGIGKVSHDCCIGEVACVRHKKDTKL